MADPEKTETETPAADAAETPAASAEGGKPVAEAVKSWEDEIAAVVEAAAAAAAEPAEGEPKTEEGEKTEEPAAGDEKKEPLEEEKSEEPAKPAETKPASDMTRRLALVAEGVRKNEVRAAELDQRETRLKPLADLQQALQAAPTRIAAVSKLLGGDDGLQEFFLELADYFHSGDGEPAKRAAAAKKEAPAVTADKIAELVAEGVKKALGEREAADLAQSKGAYVKLALRTIEADGDAYPFLFAAPPSERAITDISDAILASTGEVPEVKTVLEMIENHRKERFEKKRPGQTPPAAKKPAAEAAKPAPSKTSGNGTKPPIRRDSVPIVPVAKSYDEQVAELAAKMNAAAAG